MSHLETLQRLDPAPHGPPPYTAHEWRVGDSVQIVGGWGYVMPLDIGRTGRVVEIIPGALRMALVVEIDREAQQVVVLDSDAIPL